MAGTITLATKNLSAVIGNIFAFDRRAQAGFRRAVNRAGGAVHGRTRENMLSMGIFATGFSYDKLRLRFTREKLGFEVGWDESDYTRAGLAFYILHVVFGTTKVPARDPLFPAHEEVRPVFQRDLQDEIRRALARRGRN